MRKKEKVGANTEWISVWETEWVNERYEMSESVCMIEWVDEFRDTYVFKFMFARSRKRKKFHVQLKTNHFSQKIGN